MIRSDFPQTPPPSGPAAAAGGSPRTRAKRAEKQLQIADSALETLKTLGFARTSLRDIAAASGLSLGSLHYYFADKTELIGYCVALYKHRFITDLRAALDRADTALQVQRTLAEALTHAVADGDANHRLWYDIRTQALFDPAFRPQIAAIEAELAGLMSQALARAGRPSGPAEARLAYGALDGVFRDLMQGQITGTPRPRAEIADQLEALLARLF